MSSDWVETVFSDLCVITRGASPRPIHDWMTEGDGIPWVKISDATATNSRFIGKTSGKIKKDGASRSVEVFQGDLILSNSATPGIPRFMGINACIHDGWLLLRDFRGATKEYLYYLLEADRPKLVAQGNGSVFTNLKTDILKNHRVHLPPLQEQKAIAHILGTLDDKIELNRKTNETLEAMAKALFKSWFVDFDPVRAKAEGRPTGLPAEISDLFPDSFEDSELGEIPSGWEVGGLEEFLVLQRGFDLPAPQRIKGAYPVVAASGVSGNHNEPMAFAPGVVTGRSGVLGKVFYIQTDFFPLNTTLWAKEFRLATPIYGYFLLCDIDFAVFNAGSAVPTLNRNHLGSLRFPLPPKALVVSFTEVAVDLMKRKEGIVAETSNLSTTRDALLPKLISGEIRIPDAEKMLEEVGI